MLERTGRYFRIGDDGRPFSDSSKITLDRNRTGHTGEIIVTRDLEANGWQRVNSEHTNLADYQGQTGIDGVYRRDGPDGSEYIVVEAKSSVGDRPGNLGTSNDGTQLSDAWLDERIADPNRGGLSGNELRNYRESRVTRVKANVTNTRTGSSSTDSRGTVSYQTVGSGNTPGGVNIEGTFDPRAGTN